MSGGPTPIAIVGIGCRFPGAVNDPEQFWAMLSDGRDGIGDIPGDRFDLPRFFDAAPQTPGKTIARHGGYLSSIDRFDADFFGISPREAACIDPQHRLLLETAWEALENAGADAGKLRGTRVGVFIGQWLADFEQRLSLHPDRMDFPMTLGSGRYATSGRLSYAFDFTGPSLTIDTACSSSLTAVHLAIQSLRSGEAALALAGGVNLILAPHIHVAYSQSGMMAGDGRCKFGDARADGYVRSEGAAVVVLKPLQAALDSGDRVHAVIRGSAISNDGSASGSMGTPSLAGQQELLRRALGDARVAPAAVGYVEAHGTGTRAGDKIEVGAVAAVLGHGRSPSRPLQIGSVKTNLGHTEGAAGLAGLIKAALVVREGVIPASLNLETASPDVPWHAAPVEVPRTATAWPGDAGLRIAGVSAFGISGSNAHVLVQQPPERPRRAVAGPLLPLLPLSASNPKALRALAGQVAARLKRAPTDLEAVLAFAQERRTPLRHRAAFSAHGGCDALCEALRAYAAGGEALAEGATDSARPAKLAFVFPGQGGQWAGMARSLIAEEQVFHALLAPLDAIIRDETGWSLIERLCAAPGAMDWQAVDVVQPALCALAIAYAQWLGTAGVTAHAIVGHSMGEAGAAYACGALSSADALKVVCRRSALMREKRGQGAMALVDLPPEAARASLAGLEDRVSVAAVNSPRSCVISGDAAPVADLVEQFGRQGIFSRVINVDVASHSPHMDTPAAALFSGLDGLAPTVETIPFVSALFGRAASGTELDARYWARNLREPVRFAAAIEALSAQGVTVFVELGPHPVLAPSIEQTVGTGDRAPLVVCCGHRDRPERAALTEVVARVWCAGVPIDWARGRARPADVVDFPLYPWQRRRHWAEAATLERALGPSAVAAGPDDEARGWMHCIDWRQAAPPAPADASRSAWLVLGDVPGLAAALAARGARVESDLLDRLEVRLAAVGSHGEDVDVLIAAPDGDDAPFLPVRVAQAAPRGARARIWFVTCGAQSPEGFARVDPDHAALWGAARAMGEERPELWGGLLDLPERGDPSAQLERAAAWLLTHGGEDQIAVRSERSFVPRLVRAELADTRLQWRPDATYLISGGLGDVGLAIARTMAEDGARRFILAARTPLPPRREWSSVDPGSSAGRRIAGLRGLERLGAAVHYWQVDTSDQAAVERLIADHTAEDWPAIRGVVHLAAVLDRRLIENMTRETFDAALAAKLRSAQVLDRLLPDLDCFVLFSSMSTLLPQAGMSAYIAANAGIEALATDRRARGKPASCIAWGSWRDAGLMGGQSGAAVAETLERQGIGSFEPRRGATLFAWAASQTDGLLAVLPIDWPRFAGTRATRAGPFLADMTAADRMPSPTATTLALASGAERRTLLTQIVAEAVAQTLHVPMDDIDHGREFGTLGLTSLLAMELRNRLERALATPLSATLAWNFPTVSRLSAHLAGDEASERFTGTVVAVPERSAMAARLAAVADLSDDRALDALRRRRARRAS
ncbi:type I polyketide synthase [Chelatococcus reniformis]|uniref:Polyketide synthase n=1 Tax=Chelatococcus reniformis TaxID=1494448 RepID=A0A916XKV7_9HYPH|nr:type I polyketide synthase [Chelatococcus reniformis]GGC78334.1 hypothetical protein GCM10010994_40710 [Chelatococcus reniformis]